MTKISSPKTFANYQFKKNKAKSLSKIKSTNIKEGKALEIVNSKISLSQEQLYCRGCRA